ncbi:MAG TPA: hypothetical protein VMW65_11655 [Chloroflexota bacterium]|nr:hypothetical protein [Chloroflexota bacterium]HUX87649.1 hypothetical protein [Chloroflexota bacterium]
MSMGEPTWHLELEVVTGFERVGTIDVEGVMQDGPQWLVLLGSGETSATGRKAFEWLFQRLPSPARVAILETPAGFQPNSAVVAGKVADFLQQHLTSYSLEVTVIPARERGTAFSPDDPTLADAALLADCLFLGAGSPTYAARQLRHSILWDAVRVRFAMGAALVCASAAVLTLGAYTLPVYEIYKVGAALHWEPGLNLLGPVGQPLVFVPHWNNREGGADLDTSHCFVGQERFGRLRALLPAEANVIGIDEHTAFIVEPGRGTGLVLGRGAVTIERDGQYVRFESGSIVPRDVLGVFDWDDVANAGPPSLVERARSLRRGHENAVAPTETAPIDIQELVEQRAEARRRRDWATADALRVQVLTLGYQIEDTPNGARVRPAKTSAER